MFKMMMQKYRIMSLSCILLMSIFRLTACTQNRYSSEFKRIMDELWSGNEEIRIHNETTNEDITEQFMKEFDEAYRAGDYQKLYDFMAEEPYSISL